MTDALTHEAIGSELELLQLATRASQKRIAQLLDDEFLEFGASGKVYDKPAKLNALSEEATSAPQESLLAKNIK